MKVQATPRIRTWIAPLAIGFIALLIFGYSAFMDPDPHHDGVQIAPAIAVAEGLVIHRDVYDHYGPVTAWIHAFGVEVFGPTLLTIRLITAAFLALSAVLFFLIARRVLANGRMAALLVLAWIALWPGRSVDLVTYLFLPWPSITFLVIQLAISLIVITILNSPRHPSLLFGLLGVLTGIGVLTRLNAGLPTALIVTALVVLIAWGAKTYSGKHILVFFVGAAVGVLGILGTLALQGALPAYIQDAILVPLEGGATDGTTSWFYYKNVVLLGSIPVLLTITGIAVLARLLPRAKHLPTIATIIAVVGLTTIAATSIVGNPLRDLILSRLTWAPALDHQAFQVLFVTVLLMPLAWIAIAMLFWSARNDVQPKPPFHPMISALRTLPIDGRIVIALSLLATVSLVQLFPFIDPNHVWWAIPLPMVVVLWALIRHTSRLWSWAIVLTFALPAILIAIPRAIDYASVPRTTVTQGVLSGMRVPDERVDDIEVAQALLGDLRPRENRFDCVNGLFAVWNGTYLADDSAFVNWAPSFSPDRRIPNGGKEVICAEVGTNGEPILRDERATSIRPSFVGPLSISYYNLMYLAVLDGN